MKRLVWPCFLIALGAIALGDKPLSAQFPTNCQDICPWTPCPDAGNTTCYSFGFWITCRDYGDCTPVAGGFTAAPAELSDLAATPPAGARITSPAQAASSPVPVALGIPPAAALCVEGFCSTSAQCACPGSTCVNHVCTAGGGGGGGGGGTCHVHPFCTTDAGCVSCPGTRCLNSICQ